MLQVLRPEVLRPSGSSAQAHHDVKYARQSPEPVEPSTSSAASASTSGREWRVAVGLTKDVHFVPAKNTSVLGAGIDGKYTPINDPDAVPPPPSDDPATPPKPPTLKGKEKATYGYVEIDDETPRTAAALGPASKTETPTSPIRPRKGSASTNQPSHEVRDLCPHPIPLQWPPNRGNGAGRGLANNGNTCFLNSVLQCLLHTPPLLHVLISHLPTQCRIRPFCMTCNMRLVMNKTFDNQRGYFTPTVITQNLKVIASSMRPGRQEDAHEFLRELVESFQKSALHHSILPHPYNVSPPSSPSVANPNKVPPALAETSWVHKVFGGKLRSRVTCHSCGYNSDKFEACLDISLDLAGARSVESAFENYVKVEQLDGKGADRYKCEKCKVPVNAEKHLIIHQAPAILTVHLKRFTLTGRKITRPIEYPSRLNLAPYVSEGQHAPTYSLYGIICHSGSGPHHGHYVAYVKGANGFWHEMNDDLHYPTRLQQPPRDLMNQAYVLFYLQEPGARLDAAVGVANGFGRAGATRGILKKRKNRVESEEEEEEEEGPKRPPPSSKQPQKEKGEEVEEGVTDRVLGGPEIAAAAAREAERIASSHKSLNEKIKAAEEEKKKVSKFNRTTLPSTSASVPQKAAPKKKGGLVDYSEEEEEDMGEPVGEKAEMDVDDKTERKFIGPVMPSDRTTTATATAPETHTSDARPSNGAPFNSASARPSSNLSSIPSVAFYGSSSPAHPTQQNGKKRSPPPPPAAVPAKKLKHQHDSGESIRKRNSGLWKSNLNDSKDDAAPRTGTPIPGSRVKIQMMMKPRQKKRSLI